MWLKTAAGEGVPTGHERQLSSNSKVAFGRMLLRASTGLRRLHKHPTAVDEIGEWFVPLAG